MSLPNAMRHLILPASALALAAAAARLPAQERLVGTRSVVLTPTFDAWDFGDGIAQGSRTGVRTVAVRRATQWSVPLAASVPLAGRWKLDVETAYADGRVTVDDTARGRTGTRQYALRGPSDSRVRVTGGLVGQSLLVTAGVTVPTGQTRLSEDELGALRVIASPALGMSVPILGTGRRATAGLIAARQLGPWAYAAAATYELRDTYAPASVAAGLPALDFNPSNALHVSLGTDGLLGQHAMTLNLSADLYGTDRLHGGQLDGTASDLATRLGPIYTAEWQLRVGTAAFSELTLYAVGRYRSPFEQDGRTVAESDGAYLDGGVRAVYPASPRTGIVVGVSGRHQTGLGFDQSFASAAVTSGSLLLGVARDVGGGYTLQPFVRGQLGRLDTRAGRGTATGVSGGMALGRRF